VLPSVVECCRVLQSVAVRRARVSGVIALMYMSIAPVLQCVAVCCSVLQCVAVCCSVLQCDRIDLHEHRPRVAVCCSVIAFMHTGTRSVL